MGDDYEDLEEEGGDTDGFGGDTEDTIMPDPEGVETLEDGTTLVTLDEEGAAPVEDVGFYDNLVPEIMLRDSTFLGSVSHDLRQKIEEDRQSWQKRDKLYSEGIKRTGLSDDAPGGAQFLGASRVAHPMLTQATIDFEARAIKELFPPTGPVKVQIQGTKTKKRIEKAERIARCMNWQATKQILEFRPALEKGLMQSALNGGAYLFWGHSRRFRRPIVTMAPGDKVIVSAAATDFYSAERITYLDDITDLEFKDRVREGMYHVVGDISRPSMTPDQTKAAEARDRVEGKDKNGGPNLDGERRIYVVNTYLTGVESTLLGVGEGKDEKALPYLIHIDDTTDQVVGLYRNWEEEDELEQRMHWIAQIPFVPWEEGDIGLTHMIGGLSGAATGALRALLDSAHVNNIPTAAVLKGSGASGQSKTISPTQIVEIAAAVGMDDIRKVLMPMPYNEPSSVLYQLLAFLVEAGQGVVRTTFEKLSENNTNLPVGTTYALIEQGLQVVASIMARQHYAMQRSLAILYRINRMYLDEEEIRDEAGEVLAYRRDFRGPMDVVPVSDPGIPSDAHRMAQTQALAERAALQPALYRQRDVELAILRQLRIADPEQYLVPEQKPVEMNAANENVAAAMGRPIVAFPEQDHLAHLQAHLDFLSNPLFGFSPLFVPTFVPLMLDHIREHLTLWYVSQIFEHLQSNLMEAQGSLALPEDGLEEFLKLQDPRVREEIDRQIALVSEDVFSQRSLQPLVAMQIGPIVQQAQQLLQQYAPPMPMDPSAAQLEKAKMDQQTRNKQIDSNERTKIMSIEAAREKGAQTAALQGQQQRTRMEEVVRKEEGNDRRLAVAEAADTKRRQMEIDSRERMNLADNTTAMAIAEAEIESGERVAASTGGDSNPGG